MLLKRLSLLAISIALVAVIVTYASRDEKSSPADSTASTNATDPQWVSRRPDGAKIAVVFVHGLFGDTLGSWTADNKATFFQLLKDDPNVGDRVHTFAFGFTSDMLRGDAAGSLDIREAANKLHQVLQYHRVLEYEAVVFVAHSMGGLVVLREILNHPELVPKVPLVTLFATPQEGAQIARIGDLLLKNPALRQLVPADGNGFLQQLSDDWTRLARKPHVVCGYEKAPTYDTAMVVEWSSSTRFCSEPGVAIGGASHLTLVKPDRATHDSVMLLVNAISQHVVGRLFGAKLETPDFKSEGDYLVYELRSIEATARLVNVGRANLIINVAEVSDRKLFLTPREMPLDVPGQQMKALGINLLLGADADRYEFILKTNEPSQRRVIVRIPDRRALQAQAAVLRDAVATRLTDYLVDQRTLTLPHCHLEMRRPRSNFRRPR
jgi:pimeloyl-ACP methyl ester carboxylesterase